MDYLGVVLQFFNKYQLFAKCIKCDFSLIPVSFLGHIISNDCVEADCRKTEAVKKLLDL